MTEVKAGPKRVHYGLKYGALGRMMNLIAIRKFQKDVDFLMENWAEKASKWAAIR